jgi:hypothetical protein
MLNAWERKILRNMYEPELSERLGESEPTKNPRELLKKPTWYQVLKDEVVGAYDKNWSIDS